MPIYEYRCENCGVFEIEQKMSENALLTCPRCGGKVKRIISAAGIVFKGSGFHVTDYRKDKSKTDHKQSSEKKTGKTSDSKK